MSIENGERFLRLLRSSRELREELRAQGRAQGDDGVKAVSAGAGASCDSFELVEAVLREIDASEE